VERRVDRGDRRRDRGDRRRDRGDRRRDRGDRRWTVVRRDEGWKRYSAGRPWNGSC